MREAANRIKDNSMNIKTKYDLQGGLQALLEVYYEKYSEKWSTVYDEIQKEFKNEVCINMLID